MEEFISGTNTARWLHSESRSRWLKYVGPTCRRSAALNGKEPNLKLLKSCSWKHASSDSQAILRVTMVVPFRRNCNNYIPSGTEKKCLQKSARAAINFGRSIDDPSCRKMRLVTCTNVQGDRSQWNECARSRSAAKFGSSRERSAVARAES